MIKSIIIRDKNNSDALFSDFDNVFAYYSSYNILSRGFRKILRKLNINLVCLIFYGKWEKHLKRAEMIILFDSGIDNLSALTRYVKRRNSKIKIIFWFWNPVKSNAAALTDPNVDEIWTYSRFDAKKYNLKYNPQFYHKIQIDNKNSQSIDMLFLGRDKGRKSYLNNLEENAKLQKLKYKFIVPATEDDMIEYNEYLEHIADSKCIVDLVPNQQCGLTLRPLEALFYKKKLITNYEDIVNYDFYDRKNIFILEKDDISKLTEFVNSPYKEIDKKITDFYSYEKWLERIEKGKDVSYE